MTAAERRLLTFYRLLNRDAARVLMSCARGLARPPRNRRRTKAAAR